MSDWIEKAKDFLRGHPDRVNEGLEKPEDVIDDHTGGAYSEQVDEAGESFQEQPGLAPDGATAEPAEHPGPPPQPGPAEPPVHPSPAPPPLPHPSPGEPTVPTEPAVPTQPSVPKEPVVPAEPPFPVEPVEPPVPPGPTEPPLPDELFPSEGAQAAAPSDPAPDTSGLPGARERGGPADPDAPNPL